MNLHGPFQSRFVEIDRKRQKKMDMQLARTGDFRRNVFHCLLGHVHNYRNADANFQICKLRYICNYGRIFGHVKVDSHECKILHLECVFVKYL